MVQHWMGFLTLAELTTCTRTCREWNAWVATMPRGQHVLQGGIEAVDASLFLRHTSSLLVHVAAICAKFLSASISNETLLLFRRIHTLKLKVSVENIDAIPQLDQLHTVDLTLCMKSEDATTMDFGRWPGCLPHLHTLRLAFSERSLKFTDAQIVQLCAIASLRHVSLPPPVPWFTLNESATHWALIAKQNVPWNTFNFQTVVLQPEDMRWVTQMRQLTHLDAYNMFVYEHTPIMPRLMHLGSCFPRDPIDAQTLLSWIRRHHQLESLAWRFSNHFTVEHLQTTLEMLTRVRTLRLRYNRLCPWSATITMAKRFAPQFRNLTLELQDATQLHELVSVTRLVSLSICLQTATFDTDQLDVYSGKPSLLCPTLESFTWA
jgi:hypothetical protein